MQFRFHQLIQFHTQVALPRGIARDDNSRSSSSLPSGGSTRGVLSVDRSFLLFNVRTDVSPRHLSSVLPAHISGRALRIFHDHFVSATSAFLGHSRSVFPDALRGLDAPQSTISRTRSTELSLFPRREKIAIESRTIDNDSDVRFCFEIARYVRRFFYQRQSHSRVLGTDVETTTQIR